MALALCVLRRFLQTVCACGFFCMARGRVVLQSFICPDISITQNVFANIDEPVFVVMTNFFFYIDSVTLTQLGHWRLSLYGRINMWLIEIPAWTMKDIMIIGHHGVFGFWKTLLGCKPFGTGRGVLWLDCAKLFELCPCKKNVSFFF